MKRLRSQTSREIGERLMMTTKMEAWTLLEKRAKYRLQKKIRLQMEAQTLLYIVEDNKDRDESIDSVRRRLYALLHEARIRRELIL